MISLTINAIPKNKHKIFFHYYLFVPEQASFDLFVLYSKLQQGQLLPPPLPPWLPLVVDTNPCALAILAFFFTRVLYQGLL